MNFKEKLLGQIAALKLSAFTEKQLFVKLNALSGFDKAEIKSGLSGLIKDGIYILNESGRYVSPESIGALKGVLQGNRRGFAFFIPEKGGEDIFIPHSALNGAHHRDRVFVVPAREKDARGRREGVVASILERGVKTLVGVAAKSISGNIYITPDDKDYFTEIIIPASKLRSAQAGQKVVASIVRYGSESVECEVTEILGKPGNPATELSAIARSLGFADVFERSVKREAQLAAELPISFGGREDFRGLLTITIDGDDAKDLDDAVSLIRVGDDYKLYVHIADVSHYVKHKSILDVEAMERGTSVYFPGHVLPMLPEELSNGVCSLNEGVDRLTLTVEMLIDSNGVIKGHRLYESVINSRARMTYKNVTRIIEGDRALIERYGPIVPMLKEMLALSEILYKKRKKRGSIFFESKECVVETDKEGRPLSIKPYEYGVSNAIIEEFMLAANETVAEFISHTEYPFIYRVHEPPAEEKLFEFQNFMSGLGFKMSFGKSIEPRDVQGYLELAEGMEYKNLVNKILLRSMQKARYSELNRGHFGLAAKYYCHFTSPIRRYPDLVAHRIIKMMLNSKLDGKTVKKMHAFCHGAAISSSEREKAAESVERQCDDYYKAYFMEDKIGEGVISSVTQFGIFVELKNTVEGLARFEWLPADDYVIDEKRYFAVGRKHKFSLGDTVIVRTESADRLTRQVNFSILEACGKKIKSHNRSL